VVVYGFIIPEALASVGCHGRGAHGRLHVRMPRIILTGPGIMSPRRAGMPACMPQVGGMGPNGELGPLARCGDNRTPRSRGKGRCALRHEHLRRVGGGALECPQEPEVRPSPGRCRVVSARAPVHAPIARWPIDRWPAPCHECCRAASMAPHHHPHGRISHPMASGWAGGLPHGLHCVRPPIGSQRGGVSLFPGRSMDARRLRRCRKRTVAWRGGPRLPSCHESKARAWRCRQAYGLGKVLGLAGDHPERVLPGPLHEPRPLAAWSPHERTRALER
jgi:hypothetical protein